MTKENQNKTFWQKFFVKASTSKIRPTTSELENTKNSLVESIMQQVEKSEEQIEYESEATTTEKQHAQYARLSVTNSLLTISIFLMFGGWLFFYAVLDIDNYLYAKFNRQNLTTEVNNTKQLNQKLKQDLLSTKNFTTLLQIEKIASQLNEVNLDDPILSYQRPIGEFSTDTNGNSIYQTTNAEGSIVQIPESEILAKENTKKVATEKIIALLKKLQTTGDLKISKQALSSEMTSDYEILSKNLNSIVASENNFPSLTTKTYLGIAQKSAKKILAQIKTINLRNLIADLKNQIASISLDNVNTDTKTIVTEVQNIINTLSEKSPLSFTNALERAKKLDIKIVKSSDEVIYSKLNDIIGDSKTRGDLVAVTAIAANLSRATLINEFKNNQIIWSDVIDQVTKITRYGADLKNDDNVSYSDARRDLDPTGANIIITGYSGKLEKNSIEIRGSTKNDIDHKNSSFASLANLIDALEGSLYFYNVDGFSFAKNKNPLGDYYVPFNLKLNLQDPTIEKTGDLKITTTSTPNNSTIKVIEKKIFRRKTEISANEKARLDQIFLELHNIIKIRTNNTSNPK